MNKVEIKARLEESYDHFLKYLGKLSEDEFEYAPDGKWNAGQQAEHLIKSTRPLIQALGFPKFMISFKFGKANRPSRTYDELVAKYKQKLTTMEGDPPGSYVPKEVKYSEYSKLSKTQTEIIEKIENKLSKWSEDDLDQYIFPHPLLGKVTVREMLYFTIYHAEHHQNVVKIYLKGI
ncbi:MAG: DinB family protein [Roseivirga sp.]|jgi:hypothetical protein|uniref:DinB family protein n=1 Tax=Roseivirga sp. TaxID=1964215 RepID=UPI001B072CDA|nr:DinB family protein [Roseivirga sp.]MBO6496030.1 DinB family protein [Roseivirga sp.]